MATQSPLLEAIQLRGLEVAPSQVWGGIRIVPLLRKELRLDLRLAKRSYTEDAMLVSLDGELLAPGIKYLSYVPHGLVVSWSNDGTAAAAFGTQLDSRDGKRFGKGPFTVRVAHRMVRREDKNRLRLLPLHLAMEGFLALHFGGPEVAWGEYSRQALSKGLDPRSESSVPGAWILGLEEALRVFEIHEHQVGVLLLVADALASAFVVPHPDDYRALHRTLLEDFYGALMFQYGLYATTSRMETSIDETWVSSLADLPRAWRDALRVEHISRRNGAGSLGQEAACRTCVSCRSLPAAALRHRARPVAREPHRRSDRARNGRTRIP